MAISRRNLFLAGGPLAVAAAATTPDTVIAQAATTPNEPPKGWAGSVVSEGDIKFEVFQKGDGVAVLMHPSLGRSSQDFENLGNRIAAAGYRVVLINPRGIGSSTGPMENATLRDLGADVWTIADALKIDRAFVLGQNFGNRIARTVSSLQPDRVIGLILMACGGEIQPDEDTWAEFRRVFDLSLPPERHLKAVANSFFAPGNDASAWNHGWYAKTAQQQAEAVKRTDFKPFYSGGTAPALVIQGLNDKIAPPQNAFDFVSRRPNVRLVAFPNMGHAMLPEQPGPLADVVINFLKDQSAR
jgi:pimeloyl-ACP methyl ester carboxylesterase